MERLSLVDVSYSRLDTYTSCPLKYFYTYIAREDRTFGAAAALGNIVHGVLEKTEELDLRDMLELMDGQRGKYDPDQQISQALIDAGWQMLVEYVDRHGTETPKVLGREVQFAIVLGSAVINGYMDRVEQDPDKTIRVTDFKTGTWEYRGHARDNLQLGLYAVAAAELYGVDEIYAELYYLRSGKRPGHLFTKSDLEDAADRVSIMVEKILSDRHFHPTTDNWQCRKLCDFGKQGVCGVGKARQYY